MTIIVGLLIIFIIITSKYVNYNDEYLSKNYTNIIKGIFIIFVFISHFTSYKFALGNTWIDTIGMKITSNLGQLMVVMFLFYSGYGVMESIKRKGKEYINGLPKKRILLTWIYFAIAVFIYMIASEYWVNHNFSISDIKKTILAFIGWDGFGNSNWYIFTILVLYIITYLSAKAFNDNKKILTSTLIGVILYTTIMSFYKESYWYNTAFCYVLGLAYSIYKTQIEKWVKDREIISIVYLIVLFIISYKMKKNIVWYYIYTMAFTLIIVLITRKVKIKNIVLQWMGKNLFPMYIFQRLPMMLIKKYNFIDNTYIIFAVCFITTIIITFIWNGIMHIVSKKNIINK